MIRWLTDYLGTASYEEGYPYCQSQGMACMDVRDLVDKRGNTKEAITKKLDEGIRQLQAGKKVIVCCDYGMSRSNSLAVGIISKFEQRDFNNVVEDIIGIVGQGDIKVEVLKMVRESLKQDCDQPSRGSVILVTGASGFLGRRLIFELDKAGYQAVTTPRAEYNLEEDSIRLELLVNKTNPSHIVHLANPRIYTHNAAMGKTIAMLKNVLDVCSTTGTKLVYPSGWEVYSGYAADKLVASETLPLYAKGTYGETKLLCERLIQNYCASYDLSHTVVRFPPLYGSDSEKPKFIYNFIDKAIRNDPVTTHVFKNGPPHLDLLHVGDAVVALREIIRHDLSGEYNVGTGRGLSTRYVAELIIEAAKSKSAIMHNYFEAYAPNIVMDAAKLTRQTGWKAITRFEDWLKQQLETRGEVDHERD